MMIEYTMLITLIQSDYSGVGVESQWSHHFSIHLVTHCKAPAQSLSCGRKQSSNRFWWRERGREGGGGRWLPDAMQEERRLNKETQTLHWTLPALWTLDKANMILF